MVDEERGKCYWAPTAINCLMRRSLTARKVLRAQIRVDDWKTTGSGGQILSLEEAVDGQQGPAWSLLWHRSHGSAARMVHPLYGPIDNTDFLPAHWPNFSPLWNITLTEIRKIPGDPWGMDLSPGVSGEILMSGDTRRQVWSPEKVLVLLSVLRALSRPPRLLFSLLTTMVIRCEFLQVPQPGINTNSHSYKCSFANFRLYLLIDTGLLGKQAVRKGQEVEGWHRDKRFNEHKKFG
ncbi:hypothetical protein B0J17DRAFT_629153 [Rhizoctonia solani]|nr:hypothetical protein B0J17DRAFT_629153 [Rhizoctonia solani]